jgi:nucleolar protein 12
MLPRVLRVVRAKAVKKTERAFAASRTDSKSSKNGSKERIYNPKVSSELSSLKGRAGKLLGRAGAAQLNKKGASGANGTIMGKRASGISTGGADGMIKTPEAIVFEGYRASAKNGRPKDLKLGGKGVGKKQGKPKTRSTKRASEWKKGGVKK